MKRQDQQITGQLHSIETMGLVDGPGIRTIFFCKVARFVVYIAIILTHKILMAEES